MKIYHLTRGNQAGLYSCLVVANNEQEAINTAKDNYFTFKKGMAGNYIKEVEIQKTSFIRLIDFDDPYYEG